MEGLIDNISSFNSDLPKECIEELTKNGKKFSDLTFILQKYKIKNDYFLKIGTMPLKCLDELKYYDFYIRLSNNNYFSENDVEFVLQISPQTIFIFKMNLTS